MGTWRTITSRQSMAYGLVRFEALFHTVFYCFGLFWAVLGCFGLFLCLKMMNLTGHYCPKHALPQWARVFGVAWTPLREYQKTRARRHFLDLLERKCENMYPHYGLNVWQVTSFYANFYA